MLETLAFPEYLPIKSQQKVSHFLQGANWTAVRIILALKSVENINRTMFTSSTIKSF